LNATEENEKMKNQNKSIWRYAIFALIFGITAAIVTQAGNVIVKNGELNVSNDFSVDGDTLFGG